MSIIWPASSRWSLGWKASAGGSPTVRSCSSSGPSAAVGSGRLGRRAISSSRRSFALAAASPWRLTCALRSCLVATRLRGADLLRAVLLLGAQPLGGGGRAAPLLVGREQLPHERLQLGVAPRERIGDAVRVLPDALEVEHARRPAGVLFRRELDRRGGSLLLLAAGVLGQEVGDRLGVVADDDVSGMIAP